MKIVTSSRKHHYIAPISIFLILLITVALIAGMAGCSPPPNQYKLTISSTEGGSVTTPGEGIFAYDEVQVVNLVADTEEGYQFIKWTGNVGAIADADAHSITVTVNGNYHIEAIFAKQIWDWDGLDAVRSNLDGIYILMNSLNFTANSGSGWQPIGTSKNPFTGTFYGQGLKIKNLFIYRPDEDDVGLFGYVEKGVIKDIGLEDANVTGGNHTGALVGCSRWSTLESDTWHPYRTYSTGNVTGTSEVGGLVGRNWYGTVSLSQSWAHVAHEITDTPGTCWRAGGLVGANYGNVILCNYRGEVTGDHQVGGMVGLNGGVVGPKGYVISCQGEYTVNGNGWVGGEVGVNLGDLDSAIFEGTVDGEHWESESLIALNEGNAGNSDSSNTAPVGSYVGVLVGWNGGNIKDCIGVGNASGAQYVGGAVGYIDSGGTVDGCFAAARFEGDANFGPLWGYREEGASVTDCANVTAKQMMDITTFQELGWEICLVAAGEVNTDCRWNIEPGGYPFLSGKQLEQYNLTIFSTEGGEVRSPGEGSFTYYDGSVVNLVAEAEEGYYFVDWTGDVTTVADVEDTTTSITMSSDYSITANFAEGVGHSLTMAVDPPGTGTATDATGASPYASGVGVIIVAEPAPGYQFVNWTAPGGSFADASAAATTFTMPAQDVTVTAHFEVGTSHGVEVLDWYDLNAVRNDLGGSYVLMNDLDSTTAGYEELAAPTANGGKGWEPIGIFAGSFDGQGYEIRDLFIDRPGVSTVGLFVNVGAGGVIQNVGVVNADVTADSWVGGLVGWNDGTVSNSYSTGSVNGLSCVGGLVGINYGIVSNSYSVGSVTGNAHAGGLVGLNEGTVSNSYSTGSVTGGEYVGGLVGDNNGMVSNSYSVGSVAGNAHAGGLVGFNEGTVSNSFWDTQTSGQTTSAGGMGKTTTEMKDLATSTGAGWSITAVANAGTRNPSYTWNIVDGETYPFLSWQP